MIKLIPILIMGIIANIATVTILRYIDGMPVEFGPAGDRVIEILWISTFLGAIIISFLNRKGLFKGLMILWTLLALLLCTPIPFAFFVQVFHVNI